MLHEGLHFLNSLSLKYVAMVLLLVDYLVCVEFTLKILYLLFQRQDDGILLADALILLNHRLVHLQYAQTHLIKQLALLLIELALRCYALFKILCRCFRNTKVGLFQLRPVIQNGAAAPYLPCEANKKLN